MDKKQQLAIQVISPFALLLRWMEKVQRRLECWCVFQVGAPKQKRVGCAFPWLKFRAWAFSFF